MIRLQAVGAADVEMGGVHFAIVPPTKSVISKMEAAEKRLQESKTADDLIRAFADMLDAQLVPVDEDRRAKVVVLDLWDRDEVTFTQLERLREDIQNATRPT